MSELSPALVTSSVSALKLKITSIAWSVCKVVFHLVLANCAFVLQAYKNYNQHEKYFFHALLFIALIYKV